MDMRVKAISNEIANPWIMKKHYAKRLPSVSFCFGMFNNDNELTGIISYGSPASYTLCKGICGEQYKNSVLELNRLVVDSGNPSILIGRSLKMLPKPKIIVSFADTAMGHVGYVYQATNFIYTGYTKRRTDPFSSDGKHQRHLKCGDTIKRKLRSAKHRYIFFIGSKTEKKWMLNNLKYPVMDYPKGETRKYDSSTLIPKQMTLI